MNSCQSLYRRIATLRSILSVASIGVVIYVFFATQYHPATLVLFARTYELGTGRISVENNRGGKENISFAIGNNDGGNSLYPVELPATRISSIRIAPLAGAGKYQVDKVSLQYDDIQYIWDEHGVCQQKLLHENIAQREPCSAGSPLLTIDSDSSAAISSIPAKGVERSTLSRTVLALLCGLLFFAGAKWLFRPIVSCGKAESLLQYGGRSLGLLIVALFLFQYFQVWKSAVDVPYSEEWRYFEPDALSKGLTWDWLFGFYGMHRIALTKFLAWLNLHLFGLDFAWQDIQNYLLYGALCLLLLRFKRMTVGGRDFILFPAFLIFMFSSKSYENLLWAYQSQIHFVLLFSLLALMFAFPDDRGRRHFLLFILFSVCAMYSFAAGIVTVVTFLTLTTIHAIFSSADIQRARMPLIFSWLVLVMMMFAWFNGYPKSTLLIFLGDPRFWNFFLNLVGMGFGFNYPNAIIGLVCFISSIFPLAILLLNKESRWLRTTWLVVAAGSATMLTLASIAAGRAFLPWMASFSRYAELGFMLVPIAALAWWLAIRHSTMRNCVLVLYWALCFTGYADDWDSSPYRDTKQLNLVIQECVEDYMSGTGDGKCMGNPSSDGSRDIDSAIRLNTSFTRQYRMLHQRTRSQ
jgi:hypothetical protein